MPTYVPDYTDGEDDYDVDDDEIIVVPFVKPPPLTITLSASEDEEDGTESVQVNTNVKQSTSEKGSHSQTNETREHNVLSRSPDNSKSKSGNNSSRTHRTSRKSKSSLGNQDKEDCSLTTLFTPDTVLPVPRRRSNDDDNLTFRILIPLPPNELEQKGTAELSQHVEPGVELMSNSPDCIGTKFNTRSSEIVTDSGRCIGSSFGGSLKGKAGNESDELMPLIQISTDIFEPGFTPLVYSSTNTDNHITGHFAPIPITPVVDVRKKRADSASKNPRKRPSAKTAQEQSHSDLLKFIQHLGLPLQELPAMDTSTRKRAARKPKPLAAATSASSIQLKSTGPKESQAFVSATQETNTVADDAAGTTKPRKAKPPRKKARTSEEFGDTGEEIIFTNHDLDSVNSEIQMNVVFSEDRYNVGSEGKSTCSKNALPISMTTLTIPDAPLHRNIKSRESKESKSAPKRRNNKSDNFNENRKDLVITDSSQKIKSAEINDKPRRDKLKTSSIKVDLTQQTVNNDIQARKRQKNTNEVVTPVVAETICAETHEVNDPEIRENKSKCTSNKTAKDANTPKRKAKPSSRSNENAVEDQKIFPKKWTSTLRRFYGKLKDANIQLKDLQKSQSNSFKDWKTPEDKVSRFQKRDKRIRCDNCHQMGHSKWTCPQKTKPKICEMCGLEGHTWDGRDRPCPNSICLNCGASEKRFQAGCERCIYRPRPIECTICRVPGHDDTSCPDHWRKYHSTTEDFSVIEKCKTRIADLNCRNDALTKDLELSAINTRNARRGSVGTDGDKKKVDVAKENELALLKERKQILNQLEQELQLYNQLIAARNSKRDSAVRDASQFEQEKIYRPAFTVHCANCGVKGHNYFHCKAARYSRTTYRHKPFVIQELPPPPSILNLDVLSVRKVTLDKHSTGCLESLEIQIENPKFTSIDTVINHNELTASFVLCSGDRADNLTSVNETRCEPNLENKVTLTLNVAEHLLLLRAIDEKKTDSLFSKNDGKNVKIEILKEKCEVHLCGFEESVDQARLDIFKLLFDLKAAEKLDVPTEKSTRTEASVTSVSVNKTLVTNEEIIEELDECMSGPYVLNASKIPAIPNRNKTNHHRLASPIPTVSTEAVETFLNPVTSEVTSADGPADTLPTSAIFDKLDTTATRFQEDEIANMFDIDERVLSGSQKLLASMSIFQPRCPFSAAPRKEYIPIPVPVPVSVADYMSYTSSPGSRQGFGAFNSESYPQAEAIARAYYQTSIAFPQLPQVLPTLFANSYCTDMLKPESTEPTSKPLTPSRPQKEDSPELEIIDEVISQAASNDAISKREPRKLNNVKETLTVTLLPSEWKLFCNDKTQLLNQISKSLNVNIFLSKTDMIISIKGRNKEDRKLAQENILGFLQAEAANVPFILRLPAALVPPDEQQRNSPNKFNRDGSPERSGETGKKLPPNLFSLPISTPIKQRESGYRRNERPGSSRRSRGSDLRSDNYEKHFPRNTDFRQSINREQEYRPRSNYSTSYSNQGNRPYDRNYNPYHGSRGRGRGFVNYNRCQRYFN